LGFESAPMWTGIRGFLAIANLCTIALVLWIFYKSGWAFKAGGAQIEYKDFLSLVLTALSLMVAVLGAGIAILAVYGFQEIKREAGQVARNTATEVAKNTAEAVTTKVATEYMSQRVPEISGSADYGAAAGGEDKNGKPPTD
jgi:uncharacterized membrane protein